MNEDRDLTDRKILGIFLREHNIRLQKSLGQHFLVDRNVLEKILDAAQVEKDETVVEIGAGVGVLTKELCQKAGKVVTYEMDRKLAKILEKTLGLKYQNLTIIDKDFLDNQIHFGEGDYKVVANLPYQITTPVVRRFLEEKNLPGKMVFLVQKEVGERLAAAPGDRRRGWMSVLVQIYGRPMIAAVVEPESFLPSPEVESAILVIDEIRQPENMDVPKVLRVVKAGFSAKRRQLPNSIAGGLGISVDEARKKVAEAGIEANRRAETLTNDEWEKLSNCLVDIQGK